MAACPSVARLEQEAGRRAAVCPSRGACPQGLALSLLAACPSAAALRFLVADASQAAEVHLTVALAYVLHWAAAHAAALQTVVRLEAASRACPCSEVAGAWAVAVAGQEEACLAEWGARRQAVCFAASDMRRAASCRLAELLPDLLPMSRHALACRQAVAAGPAWAAASAVASAAAFPAAFPAVSAAAFQAAFPAALAADGLPASFPAA